MVDQASAVPTAALVRAYRHHVQLGPGQDRREILSLAPLELGAFPTPATVKPEVAVQHSITLAALSSDSRCAVVASRATMSRRPYSVVGPRDGGLVVGGAAVLPFVSLPGRRHRVVPSGASPPPGEWRLVY